MRFKLIRNNQVGWYEAMTAEILLLRQLLQDANDAFDDCTGTGSYPRELVRDETWRTYLKSAAAVALEKETDTTTR